MVTGFAQDGDATPTNRDYIIMTATAFAEMPEATPIPTEAPVTDSDDFDLTATALAEGFETPVPMPTNPPIDNNNQAGTGRNNTNTVDTFSDELSATRTSVTYEVELGIEDVVTIELTSDSFDTYLLITNPSGNTVAENDDGGSSTNSRISNFMPTVAGTYSIIATSYDNHFETGNVVSGLFELTITSNTRSADAETFSDELSATRTSVTYEVELTEGQLVTIDLVSDSFDTYLMLNDLSGMTLAEDDDGGSSTNSRISGFMAPETATYSVVITSYDVHYNTGNIPSGAFTLSVTPFEVNLINYGDVIEGAFDNPSYNFTFAGEAGDVVMIHAQSSADVWLRVEYNNSEVAYDDDSGQGLDALIGPLTLNQSGAYTIFLENYAGASGEAFTLSLYPTTVETLTYGTPVISALSAEQPFAVYDLTVADGDVLNISASGATGEIMLQDEYGYTVTSADLSYNAPQINEYLVSYGGDYRVVVIGEGESVAVLVEKVALPSLDDGSVILRFDDNIYERALSFNATAGEKVEIRITPNDAPPNSYWDISAELVEDGDYVGYYSASGGDSFSFSATMESDGEKILTFSAYGDIDSYIVELIRLGSE